MLSLPELNLNSQKYLSRMFERKVSLDSFGFGYNNLLKSPEYDVFQPSFSARLSVLGQETKVRFSNEAMNLQNPKWSTAVSRLSSEKMPDVWGDDFEIDKNIIMNTEGYDRLRNKTMVYPLPENDMILTRSMHVAQVANIAGTISKQLGLNSELTQAIAQGHDIGHAPFGHNGERALKEISREYNLQPFWHEKNGVRMVDKILLRFDKDGLKKNLNLTYAVRDGIISHCGEVDDNYIKPRNEFVDLGTIEKPAQYQPYTWEGVVVKISDKIAYLGRDIEDAIRLGFYDEKNLQDLKNIVLDSKPDFVGEVNNSSLTDLFIKDIVKNSTPQKGIGFSAEVSQIMNSLRKYSTKNLYMRDDVRCISFAETKDILFSIFNNLDLLYAGEDTIKQLYSKNNLFMNCFGDWLNTYSKGIVRNNANKNIPVYNLNDRQDYRQAIVDYISGMTDSFAVKTYKNFSQT